MKRMRWRLSVGCVLWALLAGGPVAWGYYDPAVQRWINRDPIAEPGFNAVALRGPSRPTVQGSEGANLFLFVRNAPVDYGDARGLLCCFTVTGCTLVPGAPVTTGVVVPGCLWVAYCTYSCTVAALVTGPCPPAIVRGAPCTIVHGFYRPGLSPPPTFPCPGAVTRLVPYCL